MVICRVDKNITILVSEELYETIKRENEINDKDIFSSKSPNLGSIFGSAFDNRKKLFESDGALDYFIWQIREYVAYKQGVSSHEKLDTLSKRREKIQRIYDSMTKDQKDKVGEDLFDLYI